MIVILGPMFMCCCCLCIFYH